jgi:Tfp pilus assembly protein PilE
LGTFIARALGVADTRGFDWIELIIQIVLAAIGVTIAANAYGRRGLRR